MYIVGWSSLRLNYIEAGSMVNFSICPIQLESQLRLVLIFTWKTLVSSSLRINPEDVYLFVLGSRTEFLRGVMHYLEYKV